VCEPHMFFHTTYAWPVFWPMLLAIIHSQVKVDGEDEKITAQQKSC